MLSKAIINFSEGVPLLEFVYRVFTPMPGKSDHRPFKSVLLWSREVFLFFVVVVVVVVFSVNLLILSVSMDWLVLLSGYGFT